MHSMKVKKSKNVFCLFYVERMHFRAASRDAGGRLRAHRDVRAETGRPNGSVKSARVESPRATGLSSDAYANGFIEMRMVTGVRNLTLLHKIPAPTWPKKSPPITVAP